MHYCLKKILIFFFVFSGCNSFWNKYPWFDGDFELAQSVAGNRLIMLDFYADW
tara:strand:- start:2778 stop:2936 length:159 start_codon:yes stop_codon:yes gene_type:complete